MVAIASSFTPAPVPSVIPPAPAHLLPWQQRRIVHSGELAIARGLRLVARGVCRVRGHEGAPVFIVSSASRPGRSHFVWVEHGRIHCRCEARSLRHTLTCSHAQFVRMLIVAEHAAAASVPAAVASSPAAPAPEPDPEPTPPTDGGPGSTGGPRGPRCPSCGGAADPAEIEQLGECLNCLQMRADREREDARAAALAEEWAEEERRRWEEEQAQRLPCWACGEPATVETDSGIYCETCASLSPAARALFVRARQKRITADLKKELKAETARRIQDREKAREKAHIPSAASPRARRRAGSKRQAQTSATRATVD